MYNTIEKLINNSTLSEVNTLVGLFCNKDIAGMVFKFKNGSTAISLSEKQEGDYYILKMYDISADLCLTFKDSCIIPEAYRIKLKSIIHRRKDSMSRMYAQSDEQVPYMNWDGSWKNVLPKIDLNTLEVKSFDEADEDKKDDEDELY